MHFAIANLFDFDQDNWAISPTRRLIDSISALTQIVALIQYTHIMHILFFCLNFAEKVEILIRTHTLFIVSMAIVQRGIYRMYFAYCIHLQNNVQTLCHSVQRYDLT